jgi:hypothetical protein
MDSIHIDSLHSVGADHAPEPERSLGASLVTAVYLAAVLGAPFIVRYAADANVQAFAAVAATAASSCAAAPAVDAACPAPDDVARAIPVAH